MKYKESVILFLLCMLIPMGLAAERVAETSDLAPFRPALANGSSHDGTRLVTLQWCCRPDHD
jgi:hypothetical protein